MSKSKITKNKPRHGDLKILVASRHIDSITAVTDILSGLNGVHISTNHICNGHSDPLHSLAEAPDLLIFWVGESWLIELEELMDHPISQRPSLLVCANMDDPQLMRLSMKAGALDYLKAPFDDSELKTAVLSIQEEHKKHQVKKKGAITAVINAKGGSGSSFIACNLADLMIESSSLEVALIGLDIQFGSLSGYLDIDTEYGLVETLENIEQMDSTGLKGCMMKHSSGLYLLDVKPETLLMSEDIDIDKLNILFDLLQDNYDQIVVDLPRQIDFNTSCVLDRADKILIVLQQSIAHLHDTKRLTEILRRDLAVNGDRILYAINRFDKNSELTLESISKTLRSKNLLTVPNSFIQVNESINEGEPLYKVFRRSAITKSLLSIKDKLIGEEPENKSSGLKRVFEKIKGMKL